MHIWVSVYLDHADPRIALHHPVAFAVGKAEWTDFGDDSRRLCVADENRKWMAQSTARVASPGCCELGCLAKTSKNTDVSVIEMGRAKHVFLKPRTWTWTFRKMP